ncbi:DUF192 domain-containing protein [Novosphingobium sp. AP12]|uniref:DUF192 domain-containing protein n=1 Tax=Novosphingobium sp. AP12 TaxID=1144305 RepID=UPI000271F664|nr:DUF192 domain-containing protein [Novosphingobium sp. AP12]EJL26343.1 hypothetical protein PMI02_03058 [Novosphingobium sp. AP12]
MRLTPRASRSSFAAAFLLAFAACSQGGADADAKPSATQPAVHRESGLPVVPLTVKSAKGTHAFRVEVATTTQEQAKGLMFRTQLGADEGMIFVNKPPRPASFWMRNTVIPLDIIFIGTDHRVLNIAANAVPYDESPLSSTGVTSGVLELNGGRAAELGIKAGDKVSW